MMILTVNAFLTLDGVMQAPCAADEDVGTIDGSWLETPHMALLGRTTFEVFRAFWPQVDDSDPVARAINHSRRYVVAHAGYEPDWGETTVIGSADPLSEIARLKADGEGELKVSGSAHLAAAVHGAGMIDEYHLIVFPVVVGGGKRLFADGSPPRGFAVRSSRTTVGGAVHLVLIPEPFRSGEYAVEDGHEVTRLK